MKSRRFSLAIAFALFLSLAFAFVLSSLRTGTAAPAPTVNTPFKGKVVAVSCADHCGFLLSNAQVRQAGDRTFLVGKGCHDDNPANWTEGRMTWVPMSIIVQMVEFESEEEEMKAREEYRKKNPVPAVAPAAIPLAPSRLTPVPAQAGSVIVPPK